MKTDYSYAKRMIEAEEQGQVLEYYSGTDRWSIEHDHIQGHSVGWLNNRDNIRIRPTPRKVPLGPEDIRGKMQFKWIGGGPLDRSRWQALGATGITLFSYGLGGPVTLSFMALRDDYLVTEDDGATFNRCEKDAS